MDNGVSAVDDVRLRRNGALMMSMFAFFWAVGPPPVDGAARTITLVVSVALTAITVGLALRPRGGGTLDLVGDWQQRYNRVALVEFGAIAVVVLVLAVTGQHQLIAPLVCLVVGLHFFPLATLFRQPLYRRTGIALTTVGLLAVGVAVTAGGEEGRQVAGFGAAGALWLTSFGVSLGAGRPAPVRVG